MGCVFGKSQPPPEGLAGVWVGGEDVSLAFNLEASRARYKKGRSSRPKFGSKEGVQLHISKSGYVRYVRQSGRVVHVYSGPITSWGREFAEPEVAIGCLPSLSAASFTFSDFRFAGASKAVEGFSIDGFPVERLGL